MGGGGTQAGARLSASVLCVLWAGTAGGGRCTLGAQPPVQRICRRSGSWLAWGGLGLLRKIFLDGIRRGPSGISLHWGLAGCWVAMCGRGCRCVFRVRVRMVQLGVFSG